MKKIIALHQFLIGNSVDQLTTLKTDSNAKYFPFFYKFYDRQVNQCNYYGHLSLSDTALIFKRLKKSREEIPDIQPFYISIKTIKKLEIVESNNGMTIQTADLECLFLINSKNDLYTDLIEKCKTNNIAVTRTTTK